MRATTTLFDISVVLASIATLVRLRALLAIGGTLSVVGLILLFVGYFRA